ncbi:MAG: 2-oxoglutarate dehydrogenase complex dihydrolipoyllysine-residue succinyltransferase [Bacteriovoracaceae bacterium]|nr:2-oxoglutarate dehydrogenase complex dihydrolipoyllysine-residue succinyltransferase [Bacteriovoracaceae bacterium]
MDVKIPSVGESVTEVTITQWLKSDGSAVKMDEPICEVESDKATVELPSPVSGVLKILTKAGETIKIGTVVASVAEGAVATNSAPATASAPKTAESVSTLIPPSTSAVAGFPSPAASKILSEKNIPPTNVVGSGVGGRITKSDAMSATANSASHAGTLELVKPSSIASNQSALFGEVTSPVRREKMSALRKTIAKKLVAAKNTTAMLTTFNEVDMQPVMELRKKYKDAFKEKYGINLGFMSFFTKACCLALKQFPSVNAQIDEQDVLFFESCHVGIAVSTPKGLVVPVVRHADKMSVAQIEQGIINLAGKARDGKLTIDEMQGGTFTITNGGVFGSMLSTPIINTPQSAILGMHNIVERPVAINGQVVIRPIMYVALSYDHRIIDGRESVSFLKAVKQFIEDPARMLLDM